MTTYHRCSPAARRGGIRKLFLCGCLLPCFLLGLCVTGVVATGFMYFQTMLAEYTEETAREVPTTQFSAAESETVQTRVREFASKMESGSDPGELSLSSREINVFLNSQEGLKDRIHLNLHDGKVRAEFSIPTDALPGGAGRFLNGSGELAVSLKDGELDIQLLEATVKGEPLPESVMQSLGEGNLAADAGDHPQVAAIIQRFESLAIRGDRLYLKPRKPVAQPNGNGVTNAGYNGSSRAWGKPATAPAPSYDIPGFGQVQTNDFAK